MSVEKVKAHLGRFGRENDVLTLPTSTATVELAAAALGVEPARIAKTLCFKSGEGAILIVVSGDVRIDNAKFKNEFGCKARMLCVRGSPIQVDELDSDSCRRHGHLARRLLTRPRPRRIIYLAESARVAELADAYV